MPDLPLGLREIFVPAAAALGDASSPGGGGGGGSGGGGGMGGNGGGMLGTVLRAESGRAPCDSGVLKGDNAANLHTLKLAALSPFHAARVLRQHVK